MSLGRCLQSGSPPDYPTLYLTKPFYRDEARVQNFIIYLKCMRYLVVKYKTCPGQSLYVRAVNMLLAGLWDTGMKAQANVQKWAQTHSSERMKYICRWVTHMCIWGRVSGQTPPCDPCYWLLSGGGIEVLCHLVRGLWSEIDHPIHLTQADSTIILSKTGTIRGLPELLHNRPSMGVGGYWSIISV
jgi:hypothetical protein